MERTGSCACGAIRFKVTAPFIGSGVCHCTDCQKASGGGPNYVALVPRGAITLLSGTPKRFQKAGDSGLPATRLFCGDCGTPLWSEPAEMPFVPVKLGALDDSSGLEPQMQIYTSSAPAWHRLRDDIPSFEKSPPKRPAEG